MTEYPDLEIKIRNIRIEHTFLVRQKVEHIMNRRLTKSEKDSQILNTDENLKAEQANNVSLPRNIENSTESVKFKRKDFCDTILSWDNRRPELVADYLSIHQAETDNNPFQNKNNASKYQKKGKLKS